MWKIYFSWFHVNLATLFAKSLHLYLILFYSIWNWMFTFVIVVKHKICYSGASFSCWCCRFSATRLLLLLLLVSNHNVARVNCVFVKQGKKKNSWYFFTAMHNCNNFSLVYSIHENISNWWQTNESTDFFNHNEKLYKTTSSPDIG